jgi:dynein heavy chain
VHERFLEDLNNLLNIGEIPNLFASDDRETLISDLKDIAEKQKLNLAGPM